MIAVVALGSNQGDRANYLRNALNEIKNNSLLKVLKASKLYQTMAVGGVAQAPFLNAVIEIEAAMTPHELLKFLQTVEHKNFRERNIKWGDRTLDLDLIACDELEIDSEDLILPHPLAHARGFVLVPWVEIDPEAVLRNFGQIKMLLSKIDVSDVVALEDF